MPDYSYYYPENIEEALQVLAGVRGVRIIAGGTELLPRIRSGVEKGDVLLDITRAGLNFVEAENGQVRIGAATPLCVLEESSEIKRLFPALTQAASEVGGMQTRNLGTLGGNICTGVPSADLAPPLMAYGARAIIRSLAGERVVPLEEFFLAPRRTAVGQGEMVTAVELDIPSGARGASFGKIGRRRAMRLSVVSAAACLEVREGVLKNVRLAMGTVGPVPVRLIRTEACLEGREMCGGALETVAEVMRGEISPRDSVRASAEYRREIAAVLLRKNISSAYQQAAAGGK